MTFIEALKANETEVVMFEGQTEPYYNVGSLKYSGMPVSYMMERTFKTFKKPQVVEFECRWSEFNSCIYPVEVTGNLYGTLKPMIGKKWRVRCEEIL